MATGGTIAQVYSQIAEANAVAEGRRDVGAAAVEQFGLGVPTFTHLGSAGEATQRALGAPAGAALRGARRAGWGRDAVAFLGRQVYSGQELLTPPSSIGQTFARA